MKGTDSLSGRMPCGNRRYACHGCVFIMFYKKSQNYIPYMEPYATIFVSYDEYYFLLFRKRRAFFRILSAWLNFTSNYIVYFCQNILKNFGKWSRIYHKWLHVCRERIGQTERYIRFCRCGLNDCAESCGRKLLSSAYGIWRTERSWRIWVRWSKERIRLKL